MQAPYQDKNPYTILGVAKDADNKTIKAAFRTLALKWHPDKNQSPEAEDKFKEVNAAWEVLGDSAKRKEFNATLKPPSPFGPDYAHFDARAAFRNACADLFTCASRKHSKYAHVLVRREPQQALTQALICTAVVCLVAILLVSTNSVPPLAGVFAVVVAAICGFTRPDQQIKQIWQHMKRDEQIEILDNVLLCLEALSLEDADAAADHDRKEL